MLNFDCGIYSITIPSGKIYFGQAQSFRKRWKSHLHNLNRRTHHCSEIQDAFDQHGAACIAFSRVAIVQVADLNWREQEQIDACPEETLLNRKRANAKEVRRGDQVTRETRRLLSEAKKGKPLSDSHKANMAASLIGAANPNSKPILCVEMNRTFESISTAIKFLRASGHERATQSGISRVCSGSQKTAFGYTWHYA